MSRPPDTQLAASDEAVTAQLRDATDQPCRCALCSALLAAAANAALNERRRQKTAETTP